MPTPHRLHPLLWLAALVGIGYGVHALGGRLLLGLREGHELSEELLVGFAAMPLYVPAFLALFLVYQDFPRGDRWIAVACVTYVATVIALEIAGGNPHKNHELITGDELSAVALALPLCTVISGVLTWRIVRGVDGPAPSAAP